MEEEFILRYKVLKKISHLRAADCVHGAYAVGPLLLQVPLLTYISVPPERWWSPQVWPLPSALLQEGSRHGRCSADAGWVSQFLDLLRCLVCGWCLKAKVELSCLRLVSSWIVREADFHCCFFFFSYFFNWRMKYSICIHLFNSGNTMRKSAPFSDFKRGKWKGRGMVTLQPSGSQGAPTPELHSLQCTSGPWLEFTSGLSR